MTADWNVGQSDDQDRVLLAQRFDPSRLQLVAQGKDRAGTWELLDVRTRASKILTPSGSN